MDTTDLVTLDDNPCVPPTGCPVNNLPVELLAQIFSWGVNANGGDDEDEEDQMKSGIRNQGPGWMDSLSDEDEGCFRTSLPFQVLVSHICRHWRDLSINTPSLWTKLDFSEGPPYQKSWVWIQRSQNIHLDIRIDCTDSEDEILGNVPTVHSLDDISTILDLIQPHVGRWRILEIMVNTYDYIHMALLRLSECGPAPQLQVMRFYHYEETDSIEEFHPAVLRQFFTPFQGIAPMLNTVTLWGVHIAWSAPLLSGLIDLELAYHTKDVRPSWEEFSCILRDSPNIETLTLSMSSPSALPMDSCEESVELPALTSLVLAYHEPRHVSQLMKLLPAPNLRKLTLDLDDGDFSSFANDLASAPGKTKSLLFGLEHLKIASLGCDHKTINIIYEQLVNLKSINLCCTFVDDQFFRLLIPSSGQNPSSVYCPNLEMITTSGIDGKLMKTFVTARKAAGFPIKRILMSTDDTVEDKEHEWFKEQVQSFGYFEPSDEEDDDEIVESDSEFEEVYPL